MSSRLRPRIKRLESLLAIANGAASIAFGASHNRADLPESSLAGFTPATSPLTTTIGACILTPKFTGRFAAEVAIVATNGATQDNYVAGITLATGTGLTIGGGSATVGQWRIGSATPVTVSGTGVSVVDALVQIDELLAAAETDTLSGSGTTHSPPAPFPIGVPIAFGLIMAEVGGGHALASLLVSASVYELVALTP